MTVRLQDNAEGVAEAARLLREGQTVAFGTETVYGLGADATNDRAVAAIYAAKNRPSFNPLICHLPDADAAWRIVTPDDAARKLAALFWPGPLTMVLPRRTDCPVGQLAGAGLDTLGIRVPRKADALLRAAGIPIAAPSANRSGRISPTNATHVLEELDGAIAAVLDNGPAIVGVESTVIDLSGARPKLLRAGGVTLEELQHAIGPIETAPDIATLRSPGMLASHYAPSSPVRLNITTPAPDEALLGFGPLPAHGGPTFQLSETNDLTEAASRLFAGLRQLDKLAADQSLRGIAVMPVPLNGLGLAINDRLKRAAAPR